MLPFALIEADWAAHSNLDENSQRLYILNRWRGRNEAETLEGLIHRLKGDYEFEYLQNQVEVHPARKHYDIPKILLDSTPGSNCDLIAAADSVGALYPFLMLELGLCYKEIEVVREKNPNNMWKIIFTLLEKWRQQHPKDCTTRNLLDTASFVGIDTTQIQKMV
ncbi:uncharacterized protein LOC132714752 [Ruditapes philippinarum]|uniref:uncharacterized protein LOC132714752 n=1 Tax=Ruditapes philippinarum TaxID=129788 RepID=UPI00295BC299|nr:uncharacterized protein LOC132714752 [Ruditapes philippinarum]